MSVILAAHSGRTLRGEYPLTKSVVRIGSLPDCEVQFAELEPRAITIETRLGRYFAHNRTQRELLLGGVPLPPGGALEWPEAGRLHLRRDLCLTLYAELPVPRGRPRLRPAALTGPTVAGRPTPVDLAVGPDPTSTPGRTAALLAFTVACLGAAAWVVGIRPGASSGSDEPIARLVADLQGGEAIDRAIALELQVALEGEWLGRDDVSRQHFVRARALLADHDPSDRDDNPTEARIRRETLRYLAARLR